jgi:hypothetical protein
MQFESPGGAWKVVGRDIAHDRQTVRVQPSDETFEFPNECLGCNHSSATASVTVYARGAYDPAAAMTGRPVSVNGAEGYFLPPRWPAGAVLAWQYGKYAWATAHGMSETTGSMDRLLGLAALVQPARRIPVRLPLSLSTLPADMPLSSADSWGSSVRARLSFDRCGARMFDTPVAACAKPSDTLSVRLVDSGEFSAAGLESVKIGDRDGYLRKAQSTEAAIEVAQGVVVEFSLLGPPVPDGRGSGAPEHSLEDLLAHVRWASNPADETTWPAVADWAGVPS